MARKLIGTFTAGRHMAKVYRDAEWNEYHTRFYVDGVINADADAFTTDKADALQSAQSIIDRMHALETTSIVDAPRAYAVELQVFNAMRTWATRTMVDKGHADEDERMEIVDRQEINARDWLRIAMVRGLMD